MWEIFPVWSALEPAARVMDNFTVFYSTLFADPFLPLVSPKVEFPGTILAVKRRARLSAGHSLQGQTFPLIASC